MKKIIKRLRLPLCILVGSLFLCDASSAKVSVEEAQRLYDDLSPIGAEIKGNQNHSIPDWTGAMRGLPARLTYHPGDVYPDPYRDDKPLFTITASNMAQYASKLSQGQKILFEKYPNTYQMRVYASHRDGRYSQLVEERSWFCALNTELVNGVDGLHNFTGGVPFPIPKLGAEVVMNARIVHPHPTQDALFDDLAVYNTSTRTLRRQHIIADFPFANLDNPIGRVDEAIDNYAGLVDIEVIEPPRAKGKRTVILEPLDALKYQRQAWTYIPATRRVRRAPTVGYDTPDGPGGLLTIDDTLGFNGAMDRYDWQLLGKQELYIPYHSYRFDSPDINYDKLLDNNHPNPDFMRYELHRVWIVEARLKPGTRHVYAKRRFYIDEDSWHFVLTESYDAQGKLWRVAQLNTLYDFYIKGFIARAEIFHDLQSGAYVAIRLVNNTRPTLYNVAPQGKQFYTPQDLRKRIH